MTRNYSKGKIYKIVADTEEEYAPYIGSTTKEYLSQRLAFHRYSYNYWKKYGKSKIHSFDLFERFGVEKCSIILIEKYPCDSRDQLISRERYWFDNIKNCNKIRPKITGDEEKEWDKKYYLKQLENDSEFNKKKYEKTVMLNPNDNKERYQKRREKVLEKITCECGAIIARNSLILHKKSLKHIALQN